MSSDQRPWDKRPEEAARAHDAFRKYLDMGRDRSMARVAAETGVPLGTVKNWSSKDAWVARAHAWDGHLSRVELVQKEEVAREAAERWARRRLEVAERNWARAMDVGDWADEARRQAPLFEQRVEQTRTVDSVDTQSKLPNRLTIPVKVTLKPVKWTMATVFLAYKTSAQLAASAITEATQAIAEDDGFDPLAATTDELHAYLAKHGLKALPPPG